MNAIIYARYSSEGQREESIEGQLRECKEYAELNNTTVIGTYLDRALSAKTDDRPEFQKMIHDSVKKQFEVVLVWKLDRFSRNRIDSATYRAILKRNGVRVVSAKENISDGPEGIILEAMLEHTRSYVSGLTMAAWLFSTKYCGISPWFFFCFLVRKSTVYPFCNRALPQYFSFCRMLFTVEMLHTVFPDRVGIPATTLS